jgi:hypothetical protein
MTSENYVIQLYLAFSLILPFPAAVEKEQMPPGSCNPTFCYEIISFHNQSTSSLPLSCRSNKYQTPAHSAAFVCPGLALYNMDKPYNKQAT